MSAPHRAVSLLNLTEEERDRRRQLRLVIFAWVFGAFWMWTISGAAVTRFARQMNTPDWAFGLITALPFAGNLFQLPAILLQTRLGVSRKTIFLITVGIGRLLWVASAAVPWLLPNHPHLWWKVAVVGMLLAWGFNSAGVPAWMDWMADTVPRRLRGRFFGFRQRIGQVIGVVTTMAIGMALDWVDHDASAQAAHGLSHPMLRVSAALIALAGVVGFIDILCFRWIADEHPAPPPRQEHVLAILAEPLRDRDFRRFLAFNFTLYLAFGFVAQYIVLYAFDVMRFSNLRVQVMMTAVPLIVFGICYPIWGRMIDRLGRKPVLILAGLGMINGAWGWIIIGHGSTTLSVIGYCIAFLGMVGWPGVEIASFNVLMGLTGSREGGQRNGGAYLALNALAVALGGILSGLIGAATARLLHDFHWTIPLIGVGLTYHGLLLLLSTSLRIVAVGIAAGIHEPRATPTRDAIRYVSDDFYSTFIEAIALPTRLVGGAARWTYRLPRRVMRK